MTQGDVLRRWVAVIATAGLLVALPASAAAAPGWQLPLVKSKHGKRTFISRAIHCGPGQFGRWVFLNGVRGKGLKGDVLYTAKLTSDGALHRVGKFKFVGHLPDKLHKKTARLLRRVSIRYVAGPPAEVQSVWPNGTLQATRLFNPVRTRC